MGLWGLSERDKWSWGDGIIQPYEGRVEMERREGAMTRGEMLGNPHEQAITMIDRCEEVQGTEGGSHLLNRDKASEGQKGREEWHEGNEGSGDYE